ncbi:nucleotidyltransferase substrate binding protein [Salipaludibacillus agaradhaerens]|uniref:nucleotidyltransferase substrate binding protein n=1 Tax=Salipaludibacillus agaradhaerens TaxID=76935 RepID=UPI002151250E|nr:nucleotidyltransferase substrate binding protein [Salipaludibacillus agaradhaerens]MCR6105389.1 nucleotidyltransferase substrate binding protein [Salipaludibacillus agaradhaerens]MCR6117430.1 nucleotidyltransferase substrate binding protein [Salipaludibacillus agaradhaerens]UJW56617.1 nucleotidyltransferase substrate binding protein [Bacillus sp. A116_S68]
MDQMKDVRWRQRFENFEKSYLLLKKYSQKEINNELERAGVIQFFEMTFELAWKVLKDYLESQGFIVKSPRETIKRAFQIDLINDGHIWLDALAKRNLTTHTYDDALAEKLLQDITNFYLPELTILYKKLSKD